jgi:hypothetical protein
MAFIPRRVERASGEVQLVNWSGGYVVVRLAAWQMNVNVNVIERCVEQQN